MTGLPAPGPAADRARGVAVLGLGVMGAAMAERLLACGLPVRVWNRTADRVAPLAARGAVPAATPAEAARGAEVVVLSLGDGDAVHDVLDGTDGVLAGGPLPGTLLCTSTVDPEQVAGLSARTPAVLDVGILGNREHARTGQLRCYVGGDATVLAGVRPVLDALARQVRHVGGLGSGMRLKLLMNLLMGVEVQALAEAVALGCGAGLDRGTVLEAVTESGMCTPVMAFKARRLAAGEYTAPDFRLRLMAKDLDLAERHAGTVGLDLPLTRAASATHAAAVRSGLGDLDCMAVGLAVGVPGGPDAPARRPDGGASR